MPYKLRASAFFFNYTVTLHAYDSDPVSKSGLSSFALLPMDMTICLYAISETSQAAYTSGTESQFVRDDFIRIVYLNNIPEEKTSIEIIFFLFFNYIHYL